MTERYVPTCQRFGDGFYSGGEVRLAAAITHLVDLWNMADDAHAAAVVGALQHLLTSPIGYQKRECIRALFVEQLGDDGARKLQAELRGAL